MIIKFEKLDDHDLFRLVDPTWRGDSADLVVHRDLTIALSIIWGNPVEPGEIISFEISRHPLPDSEMFTIEGKPKNQVAGAMYTNKKAGLRFICELLLMYVGPDYPEHFYIKKHD